MKLSLSVALCVIAFASLVGCQSNQTITNTWEMEPSSPWSDQYRRLSRDAFIYAQMANNTYGQMGDEYGAEDNKFLLPARYTVKHVGNNDIGFAYSIYREHSDGKLKELVLAFRGTEGLSNWDDFYYGNLTGQQLPLALDLYKTHRKALDESGHKDVPIVLTGHSLGGALAIHAAINSGHPVPYYVFNSSPRFKKIGTNEGSDDIGLLFELRHSIVETGEFLYSLRFAAKEATQTYSPFNCEKNFKSFSSHSIEKLATCITKVAMIDNPALRIEFTKKTDGANSLPE